MKKNIYLVVMIFVLLVCAIIFTGCVPKTPKPDLVPVNPQGWAGFCDVDHSATAGGPHGDLRVHIKNQGDAPAGSSHVKVSFGQYGEFIKPVPALAVGETVTVLFSIPTGCFNPDCGFEITVDALDEVKESNELNNSQFGNCLG